MAIFFQFLGDAKKQGMCSASWVDSTTMGAMAVLALIGQARTVSEGNNTKLKHGFSQVWFANLT